MIVHPFPRLLRSRGLLFSLERQAGENGENAVVLQTFFEKNVDFFSNLRIINFCMDTKKDDSIVKCDIMAEIRRNNVVVGVKQFKKALRDDRIQKTYLAANADPAVTEPIVELCKERSIVYTWVRTMAELGRACGIEVGAAVATAVK